MYSIVFLEGIEHFTSNLYILLTHFQFFFIYNGIQVLVLASIILIV